MHHSLSIWRQSIPTTTEISEQTVRLVLFTLAAKSVPPGAVYISRIQRAPGDVYISRMQRAPGDVYISRIQRAPGAVYISRIQHAPGNVYISRIQRAPATQRNYALNNARAPRNPAQLCIEQRARATQPSAIMH